MRHRTTRTWAAITVALALTALVGCASSSPTPHVEQQVDRESNGGRLYEAEKILSDGRALACVIYSDHRRGGLSCDWAGAR